ncbi:hypothetical protein V6N13_044300 [Hibiscus sabdariffa]|uniref:Titin-like n=1 Tax=Hibiscus sabdariffa TaxID=183260 RepID=A0ABR2RHR7_9ROSI
MATEAVIIQEPVSMAEKMATGAVIIAEPISMVKTEVESKHLTLDVGASNNGVETANVVAEGNHGIAKGESFLMSPEISKVANETCGVMDHTPFKAEKIAEDEEKMAVRMEEETGTRGTGQGDTVDDSEELKKQDSMDSHDPTVESLKDAKETVTEVSIPDRVNEVDDTKPEKLPAEAGKDGIILDSLGQTLTETAAESKEIACMDEKLEQVSSEEIKCKNSVMKTEELHQQAPGFETESTVEDYSTKDVDTAISGEIAEGSASIEDTTSVKDHEERLDENENAETVEVEISNKNADDSHVTVGQPVGNEHEKPHEFSGMQPKEQVYEAIGASENKEEDSEDVPKACQSRDSTNPEHIFTETAATIDLKSEDDENVKEDLEDCTAETMNEKSEEENTAATMSIEEVCKEHETEASGTVKENPETKEYPIADISNSSISDKTVKESMKEGESRPMKSTEEVSNSNIEEADSIEETEKPDNDPSPFNVKDSKEEIIPIEVKEDRVHSSLVELEESGKGTEEETNVNEDEAEGEKNEIHNVVTVEEIGVTTEHEEIGVNRANIDVKSTDSSVTCDKDVEIPEPQKEDGMQDEIPNAGSEDHIELTNKEIQLKEVPEDEVEEHSTVPSEEYEATPIAERKITDETSEKDQDLYEHLEEVAVDMKVVLDTTVKEPPVVMEVLDDMTRDEESTVPMPEGSIIEAENVNLAVCQSEEEKSKEEIPESFQQKNEPEKEKPVCQLNVVSEDVNTTTSGETVETSTNIEEATSIENSEERSEEEGREDSPTDHLQSEVNENTETVKAEISNKNADDVHVADSSIEPVKNEHEFSDVQPEGRVHEATGASKEKEEDSEDVSKAYQSRDGTNPEQTFPEAETTDLKPKTSEMENENPKFVKEVDLLDSKNFSESLEALENKQEGMQQELEDCTADATENIVEIHDSPKLTVKEDCAIIDDSLKSTEEGEKEEIPEVKVCEKLETDNTVENAEKQIIQEEDNKDQTALKEVCKGSETAASCTAKEEINLIEVKEELVHSSSFELEKSEENTEEETSVISTVDLDCPSRVAETEETKIEEAETETDGKEERNEINNEGTVVESADIDVKSADSYVTSEKDMEIPREEDGMQDKSPNQGSENQMEMPTEEIQLKEVLGDEMKEPSIMPLEEYDATLIDETSEKEQALYKHLENVGDDVKVVQATDKELAVTKGLAEMRKDEESVVSVSETAETSTNIEEATSINDHEERSEGERREEPPTDHLQIEANESYETVEVEVSNETADDLHVTDSFIGQPVDNEHQKQNKISDVQPVENEALEHKEEDILQELEDSSAEKPGPKDAVENVEDNLKQEETNEVHEGPTLIVKEDCAITDDSLKSTEEDENEETPEVEVCEKLELDNTVEIAEKQILDEEDNKGQTTLMEEMMKEKDKEENTAAMVSITEASNSVIEEMDSTEETAKPNSDPNLFDIVKDSGEELTTIKVTEDHVGSSSFELEESKNDTEEETPASCAAETEETNIKGAEAEEEKNERNNVVVVEERVLETTQLEGISVYSAEMNEKSPTEKDTEIPREIDAIQDKIPNAGSEDQLEINPEEIPSKEISDETSEKDRYLYEHSEIPPSQATDEKLMQNEDSPQPDVPKAEPEDTGNESRHEAKEQLVEEPNVEVTNVSTEEVHSEQDNQTDASEAKTLQDEKSLDLGLKPDQNEDGKPLDEATVLGDTMGTCNDDEKVVKEEDLTKNLEETESLKENSEIGKEDQIPGVIIVNDNAKVEDFNSVSNECLNEAESKEQIVAENLEVEEGSPNDGEASHGMKETEETRQDEESGDPVNVHSEDREAEKKTEEIIHDSKQGHEESCIEVVTEVRAETSLNKTDENSKALNISSVDMNPEVVESDANQETEVENMQLEEISSGLDPDVRTNDNDDAQKQNLNAEALDKDEAEVINRAPDACYMPEVRIDEAEKGLIAEMADELNKDIELGETSKTSNADELGKFEDIGPPNTVLEVKPEEQIQTSIGTLPSENEEIRIENPVEKIEEETQKESQEGSSETKTIEEVCLSNEEQREHKAVSEEGAVADQDPQNDEPNKLIQTASSTLPSEESEHGTGAISEEIKYGITKEEVQTKLDAATGDELTGEQTTSPLLVSREKDEENICTVEKTEEEKVNEADMIPDKISEGFSVAETTELCLEKEELLELDDAKRDAAEKEGEKTKEEETIKDEIEEDAKDAKTRSEIYSQIGRSVELEAVREDDTTAVETLAEKISDAQVLNVTTALPSNDDECENTVTAEMIGSEKTPDEDASLQKDQLLENEALEVDDDASSQVILTKKPDDLPGPVDTLPTDHLNPTASMLPSEFQGDEKKEIELEKEEESSENIPEQTQEIEEASDFNTEIHEKAFKNELHDETEDVAIQEKLVKATTEAEEIRLDEVSAEKVIVEAQEASESRAFIEENVVLASFEEKTESESAPVVKDQSEETLAESNKSQDDETSIDVQNQETEEQMKEEPKDKPEDEHIINREQNTNEIKAIILSEEVDKEVVKAEGSEVFKEYVIEKESRSNEIHPVPDGDETINKVEDYSAVSTESNQEAKSEEQVQAEKSEVEENSTYEKEGSPVMKELDEAEKGLIAVTVDELNRDHELGETESEASKISNADELEKIEDIGPPNTVLEVEPEVQIQTSVCTLLSEDEGIRTENPVEKIEEETQKYTKIEHEIQEISSETQMIEDVCLSNEEQREHKAVSEEETIADQDPQNDEPEERIQTASSTLPSEESEHGTGAISEEIKYGITKEEVQTKLDAATGDGVTGEQTTSPQLVSRQKDEENICTVEKTEEEKINDVDMIPDKISEGFSVAETTELCLEKEELLELDDAEKGEKTKEEETIKDEIEEDSKDAKTIVEVWSQTERSVELEVVGEDGTTAVETLAEKMSDAQVLNMTTALPSKEDECESTITAEIIESEKTPDEDASLQKDRLQEDEALPVHEASSQVIPTEKSDDLPDPVDTLPTDHLHPITSMLPTEVQGDERKETELEEEESPEKIPEETQVIEEASDFNTEVHEKAFKNELHDETEGVAIQEKLVKARTEAGETILDEVSAEKVTVEAEKTSENEDLVEDKTIEAPGQASVAMIESTSVIEENVVLEGFEEESKFESALVVEDQSEETFPESSKNQDDETSIEVQNQEAQEQIKEEFKEKLEDEHIIIREQNTNETKAVILSEEVDKGVEKAECSEGIKEYVMEKESSTNEIHPVPNGDEAINEVEDFSAVSTECNQEAKSEEQIQAENSEVEENSTNEKEGSPVMKELDEGRQDKKSGDSVNAHNEDREAEGKDEAIDDLKPGHDMSHSEAVTVERAETSLNDTEVNEERINTLNISSVQMSLENSESNASQEIEEVEKVQLEEISSNLAPEVPTNNDDEVEANKRDADEFYMAKDKSAEAENGLSVENVDQLNQYEFVETKTEASKKSLTTELEANKVEETEGAPETSSDYKSPRVETILKDEEGSTNTFSEEKSEEELQSSTHTLLCEDEEIRTARSIEKIEEEIQNDAGIKHESREELSCAKPVEEACLLNEEQRELKVVSEEETTADKGLPNDEPEAVLESEPNTGRVIADESEEHGATETSHSTSHSEEPMKDSYGEDELKEKLMEDETHEELKTSEIEIIENQIKDETIEVTGKASVAKIETTAVIEENVVLAGLEEKPRFVSALVVEDQSEETFPESSKSQDDEISIDVQNKRTEEQIEEELKEKLEDEHIINREQNKNETKAVILSEEVDKEVEKAKGSEAIEEYVMEKESSTNEIHPVPTGDEAINEVEDFSPVSTECIQETKSEEQIQAENSEVEENSTNEKGGEDREAEEKEEVINDLKLSHDLSHSEAVTAERAETSLNDTEVNDEPEAVLESETNTSQVIAEESEEHGDMEEKKIKEAESFEDEKILQSECTREIQGASENRATEVHILPGETSADNLHATASTSPSEVKENETTETESKEDESPKEILEQTGEIKEALNLNEETCEKPFELLSETDDAANDTARDEKTEGNETTANEDSKEEVMEDKEVIETSYSTSHSEEPMKDGYGEDGLKENMMEDETHEELKTSEIEIIENQTKDKTIEDPGQSSSAKIETTAVTEENVAIAGFEEKPKSETEPVIEDQSNETIPEDTKSQGLDQETEEQIKEELKDKLEDEGSIIGEENINEVTKTVILSEEVGKEVEKADGSTNEIHPVSNGDEATNEVEDYVAVSTESIQEVESEEQIQAENSEVEENSTNDKEGSHIPKVLDERKQDEKSIDPVNVHSEDREAEEKAEILDDLKLSHGESHSEAVTEERAETSLNDTEVNKELVNTSNISSAKMSLENIGIDANQETEEAEKVQLEEVSSDLAHEVPTNNNDEVEIIKRDPDEFYTAKDQNAEAENDLTEQKVDQLNQDHELIETKTEASKTSLTAELEANEVEETEAVPGTLSDHTSQSVETILKDDDSSTATFPEEKSAEQLQSSTCTLFSEDEDIRTARPIENIEEEMQNDAGIKHKIGEDSLDTKIIEEVLHQEDEALAEDNINNASAPNILSEKPEEQIQNPAVTLPSEEHKHETIQEVGKTGEMKNGDSHGEEAVEKKSTEKDETREPEETLEGETNTCQVIPEELEEHGTVTEEKKRQEAESFEDEKSTQSECTRELQGALEDGAAAVHILPGETSAVNLHPAASTLPSEVKGNETKETELQEDESPEKIQEQTREIEEVSNFNIETCGRAFDNELLAETEDAANEKKIVITNEIEVLKAEVMEDKEVTETSYSTSHLEEMIKDGSGEDELKDKLIQDNKLIVEEKKPSENEIVENQIEDDHASISRIETIAVTEENVEPAPPGFEEKPESDLEPVAEDQSKETLPEHTKSQDDKTRTDVQNQETEEQIKEELKDKVEAEGSINGEQNKNDVTKAVILSEEVDGSEDIKEHVIDEESSTNELHPVSKGDETTNEVEDCSAVSIESVEAAKSEEQIQAGNSEDEENSTDNKEGSHITKELDERRQDEESGDPVNVHGEDREAEENVETADDLKLNHDMSHSEAVAEERAETRLSDTEVNEKLENTLNISSVKMSSETIESDINQETKEVENVQLEEVSSDLAPEVPTNNNEEAEVTERDPDAFYMSKDQIAEAENGPTAELEADKVEIEGAPEPSSDNVPPRVETILKVDSTSTSTFVEEKPEEQLQSSAFTLLSIPNEEQRELKAVSEEETIADKVLPSDEPEEQIQTTSLTFPSVEREHGTGAIIEEIEYGKTKEEVPINLDVVTGDEITGKQSHETNKPEEITSSPLVSMEKEVNESSVEQVEEEKLSDAEIPEKISEIPSDVKKTAETCLENEAINDLDDAKKDTQALQMEESNEQLFTSELPVENLKHRTEANDEEEVKEVEMLEKEGPREPQAVMDQESIVAQASITEESQKIETISIVEILDDEKRKEAVKVEEENCEDSSAGETKELNEFHLVTKEESTSYLAFSEEPLHIISASAITSEESEHETKEKEDEKTSEGEIIKHGIEEDASDAKATVEICSQKGSSVEVEAVAEDEMAADDEAEKTESKKIEEAEFLQEDSGEDATLQKELLQGGEALVVENNAFSQTIPKEKPEEQISNLVVTLPSEEHKHDTISEVGKTEEEIKNGDSDGVKTVEEISTEKDQTKEAIAVLEEHESLEKIRQQTGDVAASSHINMEKNEKALNSELLDETEDAAIKENLGKAIDGSDGEAYQYEKTNEGNEIILNEVSKEEVTSHSTFQSEEPTRDGEDTLKDELIEDKTYKELIVEAQKTSENKITEKQIKDEIVKNPGQDSVVRVETATVTEDHIENMGITSSVVEEYVLIDLQERAVECSQKAEVRDIKETYPEVVKHGVEKTVDKSVEDSTKISSSEGVESLKETEDEKMSEVKIINEETEEDASDTRTAVEICSQVDTSIKLEAVTEKEMTSGQALTAKKSEEQMQNPTSALHSKEEQCIRASVAEEIESEKMEEVEVLQGDNKEDATFQKEQLQGGEALELENNASLQTIPTEKSKEQIPNPIVTLSSEEHEHETVNEVDKPEEENVKKEEMKNKDFDGGETAEELSTEKDKTKGAAHLSEGEINHLHITASALPSDVQGDETNKTETKENESLKKIPEQTEETEEASNITQEMHEKASDNETEDAEIKDNIVKVSDGGKEIILNEVSKEEIISYSTPHSEELTKDDSQEDAVKDERIEDKTYEEPIVEAGKTSENKMNEKQIECGVVEEQGQASVVRTETTTESSSELSMAEGNQKVEYVQQTGETTKTASDMQITRELDHIDKTGITSLVAKEHVPVDLQDRVAGPSQKAEVRDVKEIYPGGLECGGEITADCSGEEVTKESISTQDSIKISSDNVKSFAKEASQVSQDMIEGDAKDETNISRILQAEKSEKKSLAPVDAVEEELKEVETRDKSTSDTKTGGEICLEKEENKQPKAVVVQETIVTQAPQTKDPVSHFEDEHAGDETNETFKIPTYETQNEKPSVETQKDDANDNIGKEAVAEDETVKDDINEASIVREEIPGKEDTTESKNTTNSTGKQQFPTQQQDEAFGTSDKAVVGELEPGTGQEICSEEGVASGKGEKPDNLGAEKPEESESADLAKLSLFDLLQRSTRGTVQGTKNVIEEREIKVSNEEPPEEEAKTDEEDGGDENSKTESGIKPHKKSHNILSGMGSKVKHSISKMKKAITGKSSHSKESKPISPKESKK